MTGETTNVTLFLRVDPARPFINGRCFDDLWGIPPSAWELLYERGVVWSTELTVGDGVYAGLIIAASREHAEQVAALRGLGERVSGMVGGIVAA